MAAYVGMPEAKVATLNKPARYLSLFIKMLLPLPAHLYKSLQFENDIAAQSGFEKLLQTQLNAVKLFRTFGNLSFSSF